MSNPENQSQGKIDFDLEPPSTLFRMNWNHGLQFTDLLCIATLNRCEKLLWKFAPGWLWPLATACSNVDLWSEGPIVAPSPGETGGEVWGDSQVIWSCWEEFVEEIRGPTKCGETQIFWEGILPPCQRFLIRLMSNSSTVNCPCNSYNRWTTRTPKSGDRGSFTLELLNSSQIILGLECEMDA